ncbi:uncharacterized protein LOC142663399 isoform X2 [Rhinoderma darwinii]
MEESQMTEKILTLTLEIICLLTREDYTVVKKMCEECVSPGSCPHMSGGWSKTKSPIVELPPLSLIHERNNEKILDLTHKIIELLTGEVPIRCQDVTVYFSMEEWEYIEGHKDIYKDVMMEDHRNRTSPGLPKDGTNEYPNMRIKGEPVSCDGGTFIDYNILALKDHTQQYPSSHIKEEPLSCDRGNLEDPNIYTTTDHTQHPTTHIKEEPYSCHGGTLEDPNSSFTDHTEHPTTSIKEEPYSCHGGTLEDPNSSFTDHTPQYPPTHIKEEQDSRQEKCITTSIIYTPTNHTQQYPSTHIMGEPVSCDGGNSSITNIHISSDHTPQYSSPDIKKQPASQGKGQLPDPDIYSLTAHTQHPPTHIKEELVLCDGGENVTVTNSHKTSNCSYRFSEPVTCGRRSLSDPIIYTPTDRTQYPSTHDMEKPVSCERRNHTNTNICPSSDHLVSFEGENLYNNYGYIFTEHTYTHLNRNKFILEAEGSVEDFMDSSNHLFGASTSVEGFSTEGGLAEIQYVSNHVRSPDWYSAKVKRHDVFLSKCVEYEKHFCKVSRARICGTHLTEWAFNCSECQNCLNTTLKLIRQNLKHREDKEKPSKKTSSHAKRRTEKKEFACLDCGKHFPNKRYLLTHRRVHSEENPFHCPACGQSFEDQEGFVAHQKNSACDRPFSCSECGKRFKSRYNSEYHKKIHTENKKYLCPVCGKSFRKQSCFIVHERTHTGEKPYACPECGRCFSQNASLISHQRLHTGEKPFTCLECGRNFTQRISLVVHQRVHSGDRPYKCQECGKGFTQRIGLVQHQRRHTGEKPFTCSECGKSFTLHDSLVKHLRTHTGEKPYICSECGKRFCQSSQLTAHKRFHHSTHV